MAQNSSVDEGDGRDPPQFSMFSDNAAQKELCFELNLKQNRQDYSLKKFFSCDKRLETFTNWSHMLPQHPLKLAQAGFCYTGVADLCICPWCECTIDKWGIFDEPFNKHKAASVWGCDFLNIIFPQTSAEDTALDLSSSKLVVEEQKH